MAIDEFIKSLKAEVLGLSIDKETVAQTEAQRQVDDEGVTAEGQRWDADKPISGPPKV